MNRSKVKKIASILLIVGLICIKLINPTVNAEEIDINSLFGNEIGNGSDLNTQQENIVENTANKQVQNTTNNQVNNVVNNKTNNTTLPKTGTSENVLIALMVICIVSSVYAYKKVKEYNM